MTAVATQKRARRRSGQVVWSLSQIPGLRYLAGAGLAFQVFHLVEHGAQLIYWTGNPTAAPWLTPWAQFGADTLSVETVPGLGGEMLHLIGNLVFFGALLALALMAHRREVSDRSVGALVWAIRIQAVHVIEHALLTASVLAVGRPLGISTGFGLLLDTGAVGSTARVWAHFLINLAATVAAVIAVRRMGWQRIAQPLATPYDRTFPRV